VSPRFLKGAERDPGNMSLADHLRELRRRMFIALGAVAVALIPAWFAYPWLVDFLNAPYCEAQQSLEVATSCPGLYKRERRYAFAFVGAGTVLFALGATLAYLTLTRATEFLIGVAGSEVEVRAGIGNFTRLALLMMVAFGVGFQFPVVMVALQIVGIVTPQRLASWRRQTILLIVVLAAGITPSGDPFSLFALAVPMYLLFEVSILIGRLWLRRRRKREEARAGGTS
jgi:sec-independent protein translocase protein TatC